ncbi:MAG: hypothetical protein ACK595_14535 [Planctomycetota bacterium]
MPIALAVAFAFASFVPQQPPAPTAADHDRWARVIEPDATERAYEQIAWRNAFWPAVEEARALGRPILLWAMNGHPLGCT